MTSKVEFESKSGQPARGEIALPSGDGRHGAVLVFHEWWGLNDHMRSILDRLAAGGFLALGLDLYEGKTTKDAAEAQTLMGALDWGAAMDKATGAVAFLARHARSNGKVGALGFCMGGALTIAAASNIPELAAAVPFYGIPDLEAVKVDAINAPMLAHFATRDDWAKPEKAKALAQKMEAAGKSMQLEIYEADHAFVNDTRPEVYSDANAKLAWLRTTDFLTQHLSG